MPKKILSATFASPFARNIMILHVFNPEHDIALSQEGKHCIAPHAARLLKNDLDFLPALWAGNGELILVNDIDSATKHLQRFASFTKHCHLVSKALIHTIKDDVTEIRPWGWDECLKQSLKTLGISEKIMPTEQEISSLRQMSSRQFASPILRELRDTLPFQNIIGEAFYISDPKEITLRMRNYQKALLKAPWSSSGRGLRYISNIPDTYALNWACNVIHKQGGVMIEPFYNKVKDFGMEFFSYPDKVTYQGLSLFQTTNGAYTGNLLQSEQEKLSILAQYIPKEEITFLSKRLETVLFKHISGRYTGPLGVDMMLVANEAHHQNDKLKCFLHPMVEINMRRTMGHIALSLSQHSDAIGRVMQIEYDGSHYHLHLKAATANSTL